MFSLRETGLPGCFEVCPIKHKDERGTFVKTVHADWFKQHGLAHQFTETFFSRSKENVLRGLHFQRPPAAHAKLVYCVEGAIDDAVVDIRIGSPTFGKHAVVRLDSQQANMLYVPIGLAHGFHVPAGEALVMYHTTAVHAPQLDDGIRWDSAGIPWQTARPMLSPRDSTFKSLEEYSSPFTYSQSTSA